MGHAQRVPTNYDVPRKTFEKLAPSHRREYCEWITEAKQMETVEGRVAKAMEKSPTVRD